MADLETIDFRTVISPKGTAHLADPNKANRMLCQFTIHPEDEAAESAPIECMFCKEEARIRNIRSAPAVSR